MPSSGALARTLAVNPHLAHLVLGANVFVDPPWHNFLPPHQPALAPSNVLHWSLHIDTISIYVSSPEDIGRPYVPALVMSS